LYDNNNHNNSSDNYRDNNFHCNPKLIIFMPYIHTMSFCRNTNMSIALWITSCTHLHQRLIFTATIQDVQHDWTQQSESSCDSQWFFHD
jgi:hypothetical protein